MRESPVMNKISIRFFGDGEVRALWDEEKGRRWLSAVDTVGTLTKRIHNRKLFMTGVDYLYCDEEEDRIMELEDHE
jgi:hypothetical protein